MKKELLSFLLPLAMFGGQVSAQVCEPTSLWQSYACISRVEMNGMINETSEGVKGATDFGEYFQDDASKLITVKTGETHLLKITFSNFDSGITDTYKIKAYFDWNNDEVFSNEETLTVEFKAGKKGGLVQREFEVVVPQNAITDKKLAMRVFTFFKNNNDGDDPCGAVENGQFENYSIKVAAGNSIRSTEAAGLSIYPNPTSGVMNIQSESPVIGYSLFTLDGKLVQRSNSVSNVIDVTGNAVGMYILKVITEAGVSQSTIIVE